MEVVESDKLDANTAWENIKETLLKAIDGRPKFGNAEKHGKWNEEFITFYAFVDLEKAIDWNPG